MGVFLEEHEGSRLDSSGAKSASCQSVHIEGLVQALRLSPHEQDQKLGSEVKRMVQAQQSTIETKQLKREMLPQGTGINMYVHLMIEVLRDAAKSMEDFSSIHSARSQQRVDDKKLWIFLSRGALTHTLSLYPLSQKDLLNDDNEGLHNVKLVAYDTQRLRASIPYYVRNSIDFIQGNTAVPLLYRDLGHAVKIPTAADAFHGLRNTVQHNSEYFHRLADILSETLGCTVCNDRLQKLLLQMAEEVESWTW